MENQNDRTSEESLRKAKDEMEMRVAERTAELVSVNQRLQRELDERRRVEETLRLSQARFAGILEIADDAIISVDSSQCITLFNQGAERIFGYTAQEIIGQPLDLLIPERFTQSHRRHIEDFRHSSGRARRMGERQEIYGRRKDNTEFPAEASISRLDVEGERIFTVILRDITIRKQAEDTLERLSRQNELILNSIGEGLLGLNNDGIITFANPAAGRLLGYKLSSLVGQSIQLILPTIQADGTPYHFHQSPLYTSLTEGKAYQANNEVFKKHDSSTFAVEYTITPIYRHAEIAGAVVTFKDITDRQLVERMKDEFISVVSHELRTPLTSIHGSLGMLASGLLSSQPEKSQRLLEIAVDSTDRLVRLINDILDIERIESGKVNMVKQNCNIADLMEDAVAVMQAMADKVNVNLEFSSISIELFVDPDRIIQTLTNLLSNAIKFSPTGGTVQLKAEVISSEINTALLEQVTNEELANLVAVDGVVLFSVQDKGRGIPSDKLETIFERFQQVDASDSRNNDGTGLGLAICRSIVQQHDGVIWVDSILGEGSTFYFALPLPPETKRDALTPDEDIWQYPLVLLCDDDPSICMVLKTLLEEHQYRVVTAGSGADAIEQALLTKPDIVLLDLLMPGMNGWEVMAVLKEREDTKDIPIIICSVSSPSSQNHTHDDFVDWVNKPVDEAYLFQSLRHALSTPSRAVKVLVIEDDMDLAQVLIALLERHEIQTFHARTGREAIRLSQQLNPDMLILDVVLPDGDGFAVVEWLQQHNFLSSVPLVIYSAKDLDISERDRLRLGQTEFMTKGRVTTQEFEQRVLALLQRIARNQPKDSSNDN